MVIFEKSSRITASVLPKEIGGHADAGTSSEASSLSLEEATARFRRRYIEDVLQAHGGKVDAAAQALNINRTHLYKLLKSLGLDQG
jgi:DNA-binding NtrC family response regulator